MDRIAARCAHAKKGSDSGTTNRVCDPALGFSAPSGTERYRLLSGFHLIGRLLRSAHPGDSLLDELLEALPPVGIDGPFVQEQDGVVIVGICRDDSRSPTWIKQISGRLRTVAIGLPVVVDDGKGINEYPRQWPSGSLNDGRLGA